MSPADIQQVKAQGHTTPKLDFESWHSRHFGRVGFQVFDM